MQLYRGFHTICRGMTMAGIAAVVVAAVGACKPKATCEPGEYRVQVVLHPGQPLNPGEHGESLATTLHLVQLADDELVGRVGLDELRADPSAAFGESYIAHEDIEVWADTDEVRTLRPKPETRVLMLVAEYRQVLGSGWYLTYEVPRQADHENAVCTAVHRKKPPLADPCFFALLERYEMRGGATPPAGLKRDQIRVRGKVIRCAPPAHQYIIDPKIARKEDKKRRLDPSKIPTRLPTAPRAPAPAAPGAGASNVPTAAPPRPL